jgi:SnoaL-like domain
LSTRPHPAVAATLERWHAMVARRDLSGLPEWVDPDAVFRSPMAHHPYPGREAVVFILNTVMGVFENFRYHRQLYSDDGLNVVLEFSAEVNGRQLKGIDLIRFDAAGRICEFEVMVRPMSGLAALGEEMAKRVAHALPALQTAAARGGPGA